MQLAQDLFGNLKQTCGPQAARMLVEVEAVMVLMVLMLMMVPIIVMVVVLVTVNPSSVCGPMGALALGASRLELK